MGWQWRQERCAWQRLLEAVEQRQLHCATQVPALPWHYSGSRLPIQHTVFACQRTHQLYCCCWWLLLLLLLLCLQVFQVRARASGKVFAMKVMRKERILQKDHGDYVRAERDLLTAVVHPYIVTLRYSFQSASKLYLVLDFINGGHLFFNLYRQVCGGSIVCCSWGSVGKGRAC